MLSSKFQWRGPEIAGGLLATVGVAVVCQWIWGAAVIAWLIPGSASMGIVNPLLTIAIGVCFIVMAGDGTLPSGRRWLVSGCIAALLLLPLAYLAEHLTGLSLGVDFTRAGTLPGPGNSHPGRISPNASLAFLLTGAALWLHRQAPTARRRRLYLVCTITVSVISLAGLAGYFVGLEALYQIASFNAMLPGTAMCLSIAAAGLWMLDRDEDSLDPNALNGVERRIHQRSLVVLGLVALAAGVAGFSAMRSTFEESVSQHLLLTARTNARALGDTIELSLWFPRTASTRPPIRKAMSTLNSSPGDAEARLLLATIASTFVPLGVSGVEFRDAADAVIARAGQFARADGQTRYRLNLPGIKAALVVQDGYLLATDIDVVVDGRSVGRIVAEQRLRLIDGMLAQVRASSESSDAAIVGRDGDTLVSAPTRFRTTGLRTPMFAPDGKPSRPVVRALLGQHGVEVLKDQRGVPVMTAYAPVNDLGVAFALKVDVATLYAPLRPRLNVLVLSIIGIIGLGLYAQRNQVRPVLNQLVESQGRLRAILEDQSEFVSLATPDGTLTYVNPAYARHFDLRPADMLRRNLFDFVEPAHRDEVRQLFAQLLLQEQPLRGENRMVSVDGADRWVAWTNSVQQGKAGRLIHSVGRDVTDRKHAEMALHSSQSLLARTGRVAGVGGWELEIGADVIIWSDETRRIHEVPDDFVPTLDAAIRFYTPQARPLIESAVKQALDDGTPWDLELPLVTATGRSIWVRAQGEVEFENGRPVRLVGAFQDITERKLLQRRLTASELFIRKITDSLPVRMAYVDRDSRFRFVNQAHCKRFGLDREQIIGRTPSELTAGSIDAQVAPRLEAALAGEEQCFEFDEDAQGVPRRIEARLIPDLADDGQVQGLFTSGIDVTERSHAERSLRELTVIFDNTTDYVVQADARGQVVYMNPAARALVGLSSDAPTTGRSFNDFNTPETRRQYIEAIMPAVKAQGVWVGETTVYAGGQRVVPVSHMVIAHRDVDGRASRYSAIMRDISTEVAAKEEAERQAVTLRSVSEAIPALVTVVGADERYRFVNSGFERWSGSPREEIVGRTLMEVLGLTDYHRSRPWVDRVMAGESVSFELAYDGRTSFRHLTVSYIPLRLEDGSIDGFVGVAQDITRHKDEEARLQQLAQRDPLTGLLNRCGFEHYLQNRPHVNARSASRLLALLYIDLDRFKPVNDAHGHPVGDQVLQIFAKRLQRIVRPTDAVARLGGDEFAIALDAIRESANARGVAEKVLAAAAETFQVGELRLSIGASIGVAYGEGWGEEWREVVKTADARLYEAKAAGRGRHAGTLPSQFA